MIQINSRESANLGLKRVEKPLRQQRRKPCLKKPIFGTGEGPISTRCRREAARHMLSDQPVGESTEVQSESVRRRLLPGERVVWSGSPGQGLILTRRDIFLIPFSLLWCGFAIFWTVGATGMGAPSFFTLWGAMFICIGLYFVVGRFFVDAWVRRGTEYALTDRRALIYRPAPFSKFTAVSLTQLPDLDLVERPDGSGTIKFGQVISPWGNRGMGAWSPSLDPTPQFIAIKEARRVFDLLQQSSADRI